MPVEIERKFLLKNDQWRDEVTGQSRIIQGYLANNDRCSVRVRVSDDRADINIKSMTIDIERSEFQYPVPLDEAHTLLDTLCVKPLIIKTRYLVPRAPHTWEIDVFEGENAGLVVAEIELESRQSRFERPDWLGPEVSRDPRYFNISLVNYPYCRWDDSPVGA